ncbi:MAG TPA: hypothetical protein PLY88_05590 [Candidatus Omnitrophota bacterium]|nr:hypothetical protein [Candidatus Omnitrophota bacterium]
MKWLNSINSQKGAALISTYIIGLISLTYSIASYSSALYQAKHLERDVQKVGSYAAAEAGIQKAMQQIAQGAYTGTIDTTAIAATTYQSTAGVNVGTYSVSVAYNNADWVIVTATGTSGGSTTVLEGSVFLESPLSKYSVYMTDNTTAGNNLVFGASDGVNPRGVPENYVKRSKYYFQNDFTFGGSNINIYGDLNVQGGVAGHSSYTSQVYGDTYVGDYAENSSGAVTNTGITNYNRVNISDGFSDDEDRNSNGSVTSTDAPDVHDLNSTGANDANKIETLPAVTTSWYSANNSVGAFNTAGNRFLILEDNGSGTATVVKNVTATQYKAYVTTGTFSGTPTSTHTLPNKAVVYNNGSMYVTGSVTGRVSFVASNDIYMDGGGVSYYGGANYASSANSAAFIASDQIFLRGNSMNLSGILYARNTGNHTVGIEASYAPDSSNYTNSVSDTSKSYLRFYGNTVMDGTANTSVYADRAYVWDSNLSKYRPPGISVVPELRMVREVVSD